MVDYRIVLGLGQGQLLLTPLERSVLEKSVQVLSLLLFRRDGSPGRLQLLRLEFRPLFVLNKFGFRAHD